jgi:hypothetical protein
MFPLTEDPIAENGRWIDGQTVGLDWGNVRTAGGEAMGVSQPGPAQDPTAVLSGAWPPDQEVEATIALKAPLSCCHQVELRLRTTIAPHSITGYEVNCTLETVGGALRIARWNGSAGNFTLGNSANVGCANGDRLKAAIAGSTITVYKNDVQVLQGTDGTFASGSPGLGFFDSDGAHFADFGLSALSVLAH